MKMRFRSLRSERGSALIVAMFFAAIIEISILSYLGLSRTSMTISNRALYNNGAMNLAENGLEEAMYSINKMIADSSYSWTSNGWTPVGATDVRRRLPTSGTYNFDQGATGIVRVYVYDYAGTVSAPRAVARSTITLGGNSGAVVEKWVQVQLRKTSKFANGLVARNSIVFSGNNASVDSWNSDPDNDGAGIVSYNPSDPTIRNDNGSVGSISVSVDAVMVKQADVWGYVSTGGADPTTGVGNNGSILGEGSVYDPFTWAKTTVDPSRVATDFSASFDNVAAPTYDYDLGNVNTDKTLPLGGATPRADGKYYYHANSVSLTNKYLKASGNKKVVLVVGGDLSVGGGSGTIVVENGSELEIYVNGNVDIKGQGAANGTPSNPSSGPTYAECQPPSKFQIYGTNTTSQTIDITGNGKLAAVVYAPNASFIFRGNAEVLGSVVASNISATGNAAFHYDENLANFGGDSPYRVSLWKELTSATDRSAVSGNLNFN